MPPQGSKRILSGIDVFIRETSLPSIPSFSQSMDYVLGDQGLRLGTLMELLGLPGSGKTQLCLQLCASVQIPQLVGGLDAEALYIDTNTNFTACRFKEILSSTFLRCQGMSRLPLTHRIDALNRLHYANAFGLEKFVAFMGRLPKLIESKPNIRLIVIDSITFPFKVGLEPRYRTGLLYRLISDLQRIAVEKQISVVLTNEMSTRVGLTGGSAVGALGDAWAHRCNLRVLLSRNGSRCRAAVLKSTHRHNIVGEFQVLKALMMMNRAHILVQTLADFVENVQAGKDVTFLTFEIG